MKRLQRMPGASFERPRVYKLSDIESHSSKGSGGCSRSLEEPSAAGTAGTPLSSASNMGSIARFPKLDECAHFHYEHVELGKIEVSLSSKHSSDEDHQQQQHEDEVEEEEEMEKAFSIRVTSGDACWTLERTHENLLMFDQQLHRCIFDRSYSRLAELSESRACSGEAVREYFERFSALSHEGLNCGPVLNWLQLDNRGRRILVPEADNCPINTPAVAAAYAVRPYAAQAQDEISFQVGDMISVIDMPPPGESSWWRGKRGFAVGFFPAECVAVIGDKLPRHLAPLQQQQQGVRHVQLLHQLQPKSGQPVKPVLRKHGKLIAFFRSFILNRPSRRRLKQSGILRERVFGCDLGEHLLNSARDVPNVLSCCAEFIERHGLVDGIYRLSGVTSNIQRLRHAFDEDRVPNLYSDQHILRDIHSVASLLKMYFRELPNPLCTYQLYSCFVAAVQPVGDAERLTRMREAVRKLPPPHYRTLEYLMRHLVRVADRGNETGMTARNVAIVWAPNLLRCKELEVGGVAALQGVGVQAVVTEFLICYAEVIFAPGPLENAPEVQRPKSLAIAANSSRLLSLEEARSRSVAPEPALIEVGAGSAGLPQHYHTVIELPAGSQRKRHGSKRSPSLNWRALFGGRGASQAKARSGSGGSASEVPTTTAAAVSSPTCGLVRGDEVGSSLRRLLRPVLSADSLDGAPSSGEDALGPLCGQRTAPPPRTCGHSRSVSHDSYFEHLGSGSGDAASATSGLDLSEIQLNFELEEREMRMLSEGTAADSARQSLEASPRRQRDPPQSLAHVATHEVVDSAAGLLPASSSGGSKRKRSRLEERLQCDVDLRFIDSQSPDQVMVTADVHEMETPSPLPTPGYLPLLSEGSTPLSPNASPAAAVPISPRISFKSFTLPLDLLDEQLDSRMPSNNNNNNNSRKQRDSSSSSCLDLDVNAPLSNAESMEACCEVLVETPSEQYTPASTVTASSPLVEIVDQEMRPCVKVVLACDRASIETPQETSYHGLDGSSSSCSSSLPQQGEKHSNLDNTFGGEISSQTESSLISSNSKGPHSLIDVDSLMPYEQRYESVLQSNVASQDNASTTKTTSVEPENWLMTDEAVSLPEAQSPQQVSNISSSLAPLESSSILNKNCQESMCCLSSDKPLPKSSSNQLPTIEASSNNGNSQVVTSIDSNVMDQTVVENLPISFETDEAPTSDESPEITSEIRNPQPSPNSLVNYETSLIKTCSSDCWNVVDDQNSNETNQIKPQECILNENYSANNDNCENIAPNTQGYEQKQKSTEKSNGDESKKLFNANLGLFEQMSNSHNLRFAQSCHLKEVESSRAQDDVDVVVPSNDAAVEPQEMAHVPEMQPAENSSSCNYSPMRYASLKRGSGVNKDTATILQELALQRLSGGESIGSRRRYDSDSVRDRRSFDSEIGREIVREHKMKLELEHARGESLASGNNQNVPPSHLPPCLRARHARATRAALSRSLDEAKFNKMTNTPAGEYLKQDKSENAQQQHASTPNVRGSKCNLQQQQQQLGALDRSSHQSLNKNLGLDLDDPRCRERIEKYKEERRTFLRDKYRSESFRAQAGSAVDGDNGPASQAKSKSQDGEQALLARLKQRATRPSLL